MGGARYEIGKMDGKEMNKEIQIANLNEESKVRMCRYWEGELGSNGGTRKSGGKRWRMGDGEGEGQIGDR